MMKNKCMSLMKNWLLLLVILSFCISFVAFFMGLTMAIQDKYAASHIQLEVVGKEVSASKYAAVLQIEFKNESPYDVYDADIAIEIMDEDGNILSAPEGTIYFSRDYLETQQTKTIYVDCELRSDSDAGRYIYQASFEELRFSARAEGVSYTNGKTSSVYDTASAFGDATVKSHGFLGLGFLAAFGIAFSVAYLPYRAQRAAKGPESLTVKKK